MARKARLRSVSGIYRVVLRGDMIFPADNNAAAFLEILKSEVESDFAEIYAFCLLNKTISIVVKEGLSGISPFMMRVCSRYALRLKAQFGQTNYKVFNGRFLSFPLETDADVLEGVRQTHRMPLKLGLSLDYEWSSYHTYFKDNSLIESTPLVHIAGSIIDFRIYNEKPDEDEEKKPSFVLTDAELRRKITQIVKQYPPDTLGDEPVQAEILKRIEQIEGAEIEAVMRILGAQRGAEEKS